LGTEEKTNGDRNFYGLSFVWLRYFNNWRARLRRGAENSPKMGRSAVLLEFFLAY